MKPLVLLVLVFTSMTASAEMDCGPESQALPFFNRLAGSWHGEAVFTPVGPRPYDIFFERRESLWIYGQANPGAAIHHWGFYCESDEQGGELWLRFLTTFRGNRDPVLLKATSIAGNEIHFKAIRPEFLEVKVTYSPQNSYFEVLHHGKRHVLIELDRDTINQGKN